MLEYRLHRWLRSAPVPLPIRRSGLPGPWREQLTLGDGRQLIIRPILEADAEMMRQGFALLTPEEVRMRFLHPIREMTPEMARQLTQLRAGRDFALVVSEDLPPGEALVGAVVRASIDDDSRRAEFAILVSHFLSGNGLGRLLMKKVIRWARLKRLDELYGDVLDDNTAMLGLALSLGFSREHVSGEPGVTHIRLDLRRPN